MQRGTSTSAARGRLAFLPVLLLLVLVVGGRAARADDPEPLRIVASVSGPLGRSVPTTVTIEPDGTARIVQWSRQTKDPDTRVEFGLPPAEMAEARRLVIASRFFETWGPPSGSTDQPSWNVKIRLGERELHRPEFGTQPEFEGLAQYLWRFVRQADATADLRRGTYGTARLLLVYGQSGGVPSPSALATEIVACAQGLDEPRRCAEAAAMLVALPSPDDWVRSAQYLLARLEGNRRGAVLSAWAEELRRPDRAGHREAFRETALAEIEGSWSLWPSRPPGEAAGGGAILAMLLRDRVPEAFVVAESMAKTFGTVEEPVVPPGLLETGGAAVPVMLDLLENASPGARASGAEMARRDAGIVRKKEVLSDRLSPADLDALEKRFAIEVVPALERRVQDAAESFTVRERCLVALDRWDGRVKAANAAKATASKALQEEHAKREGTAPPPPSLEVGTLSIGGRLLGLADAPLPGVGVTFLRRDGRSLGSAVTRGDGSFLVERLAEGAYDVLEETQPGQALRGIQRGSLRLGEGIAAGTGDVVLRVPGSVIRGRLFDPAGSPAASWTILAQMRDAPSEQGPAYSSGMGATDAQGRFAILRLMPGVYDLQVLGHAAVRGVSGIEAGPTERRVEMLAGGTIAGRVIDETGAPLPDLWVSAALPGAQWDPLQVGRTEADGTFRLQRLDPSHRYQVWATFVGGENRNAVAGDVSTGSTDLILRIDTMPQLRFRVDSLDRLGSRPSIRIERIAGGPPETRTPIMTGSSFLWRAALAGTWKVSARVRDVDANGLPIYEWTDLGSATTGEPEKAFTVPR